MNVASKELCQELYELSGWDDQTWWHCYEWDVNGYRTGEQDVQPVSVIEYEDADEHKIVSAYDLGYLLRKLPPYCWVYYEPDWAKWVATKNGMEHARSDIPEDAMCKLAIELFKQGVLQRD